MYTFLYVWPDKFRHHPSFHWSLKLRIAGCSFLLESAQLFYYCLFLHHIDGSGELAAYPRTSTVWGRGQSQSGQEASAPEADFVQSSSLLILVAATWMASRCLINTSDASERSRLCWKSNLWAVKGKCKWCRIVRTAAESSPASWCEVGLLGWLCAAVCVVLNLPPSHLSEGEPVEDDVPFVWRPSLHENIRLLLH